MQTPTGRLSEGDQSVRPRSESKDFRSAPRLSRMTRVALPKAGGHENLLALGSQDNSGGRAELSECPEVAAAGTITSKVPEADVDAVIAGPDGPVTATLTC